MGWMQKVRTPVVLLQYLDLPEKYTYSSKNTWVKVANLSGAKKIIDEFEKKEIEKNARLPKREVEKIVNEKINKDETFFLVKWKGYKSE